MKGALVLAALSAALLAGCGGDGGAETPIFPRDLAESLANQSDSVAATLDSGDPCRAAEEARALRDSAIAAVNAGRVPSPYQEELGASAQELVSATETACAAAQAPAVTTEPDEDEDEDEGKGRGKGKGKHRKKDDDELLETDTLPTITTVVTETGPVGDE